MSDAPRGRPRLDLFAISLPVCAAVAVLGLVAPGAMTAGADAITGTAFRALDWFFMAAVSAMLVLALWLAFGRYGRVRLGGDDERPEFSTISWLAMLFAAGMGVGLLFWGVAEPVIHYSSPPVGEGGTPESARRAMVLTLFHWGLHAWAVYTVAALVLAYFGFRRGTPYLAGAPLRSAFRGRWVEPVARAADLIAVLAVVFGVAGSIAMGALQLQTGIAAVTDLSADATWLAILILALLFVSYMTSAATSLDKGIKILSDINMGLAVLLVLFVLAAGPTASLLRAMLTAVGDYTADLVGMSLRLYPYADLGGWLHGWTLVYFIWWIAWAPFVGIFIARISRGRTIREFVTGVLLAPTALSVVWFGTFGGTALFEDMRGAGGVVELVREDVTVALFSMFERLPLSAALSGTALALVFIFLVTSVDSATYVLGMLTSRGALDPPVRRKLAWGITLAVLGAAMRFTGSIDVVRAVSIVGALPFTLILMLQIAALLRALREDRARSEAPATEPAEQAAVEGVP